MTNRMPDPSKALYIPASKKSQGSGNRKNKNTKVAHAVTHTSQYAKYDAWGDALRSLKAAGIQVQP